jgi:2-polyprenyl-6-methoxyphenol hydroxylase-like FAD-dependent oxidoreductase
MVWIMNHDVTGTEKESWNNTIDAEEVLQGMDEMPGMEKVKWAPIFKELVKVTPPDTIVNFELLWRNPQPSWTSPNARIIQVGDSAHSYLPASGNGATQAIEDAISIASCLQIGGKENVPQSVRAHIRFRYTYPSPCHAFSPLLTNPQIHPQLLRPKTRLLQRRASPRHRLGQSQTRPASSCAQAAQVGLVARPGSVCV